MTRNYRFSMREQTPRDGYSKWRPRALVLTFSNNLKRSNCSKYLDYFGQSTLIIYSKVLEQPALFSATLDVHRKTCLNCSKGSTTYGRNNAEEIYQ